MICFPNSKINLGLHVINKREDGFHNLESLFLPIPLCDILEIAPLNIDSKNKFEYKPYGLAVDGELEKNLIYKAWLLLANKYDLSPISCAFYKNIPMGAGLGGGSSDAAFCLKLLNDYFKLGLSKNELLDYAAILGSDCPFFIENKPSFISGRGEIIENFELNLKGYHLVIVKPEVHISTAMAFSAVNKRGENAKGELKGILRQPISAWKNSLFNDFEKSIFPHAPIIEAIKNQLYATNAIYASMSGSGSAVFGIFDKKQNLKSEFKEHFYFECEL
jgi:4-diphosphocytidyl-2-C-methyl-D-erythritol kinase